MGKLHQLFGFTIWLKIFRTTGTRFGGRTPSFDALSYGLPLIFVAHTSTSERHVGVTRPVVTKYAEVAEFRPRAASKVSLATLVGIANALECSVDDLLCDSTLYEREAFENQLVELSKDCTPKELRLLTDLVYAMKESIRKRSYDE